MNELLPIIVLNWNGLSDTYECIESILDSDMDNIKIFLVDNCSSNEEGKQLYHKYGDHPKVEIVLNQSNIGFGAAHNLIVYKHLNNINYSHVCLINNDAVVEPTCLGKASQFAVEKEVDVLSMKMIDYNNRNIVDNSGHKLLTNGEILPIGSGQSINHFNKIANNVGASGGACLISKKCIENIGLFDPYFFVGYEDAEYGLRAKLTGHSCIYYPEAIVYHKGGQSIKKVFNSNYSIQTFVNIKYSNYKLLPALLLIIFAPYRFIRTCFIILISLIIFRWTIVNVLIKSAIQFYTKDIKLALKARKKLRVNNKLMSTIDVLKLMNSTVVNDITKFSSIFISKKPSAIEKYR